MIDARSKNGPKHEILVDIDRKPITYNKLITSSFVLGKKIANNTKNGEFVGLLLPNMTSSIIAFFAIQAYGRVPAMLNFSTGSKNLISAIKNC